MRNRSILDCAGLSACVFVAALASGAVGRERGPKDGLQLFTEQEALELRVQENQWDPVPRARSAPLGPVIVIYVPEVQRLDGGDTIQTSSPTRMLVEFQENQAPVDMRSLRIRAKKGPFSKSLTEELSPFLDGTKLAVDGVEVPAGKFQIQIEVKDLEGHETTRTYRLIVEDRPGDSR